MEGVSIQEPRQLQVRGSVLNSDVVDQKSPITYGYGSRLPLYFSGAPVLSMTSAFGIPGAMVAFGGGTAGGRETAFPVKKERSIT